MRKRLSFFNRFYIDFSSLASKLAAKTAMDRQYLVAGVDLPEVLGYYRSLSSGHRGG
jgi:hypothetical protein